MKNNIDYYQHYANADQHPKFKMLRVSYGWAGEGRFWALNNRIAQAENCCLDISKKYNAASIASDLGLTFTEFQEYIECLKTDCELIRECEPGVITTDIIQENFQSVATNREKARERKKRYLEKVSKGSPELSESLPEQNYKVKERKGKETYTRIVEYLNAKTQSKFKPTSKVTRQHIDARAKEGFSPEDFKAVIDFKCKQWIGDPKMQEYLRPSTLFNSNFEAYLNAARRNGTAPTVERKTPEQIEAEMKEALS